MFNKINNIKIIILLFSVFSHVFSLPVQENIAPTTEKIYKTICDKIVIAHRGASGYIPEHTLGAYALAIMMGADYIEPDLVMTKDGQLISRHDNELSTTTNVAQHTEFASRRRNKTIDGIPLEGWFTEDFTLNEIKTLRAMERLPTIRPGNARMDGTFTIPTFQEIIDLIKTLQINQKQIIGIYPEIKHSTHFRNIGLPMEQLLLDTFRNNGYWKSTDPVYIQSFEVSNLKNLKKQTDIRLLQLFDKKELQPYDQVVLGTNLTYGDMASVEGLIEIAKYANAVGPDKSYIIPRDKDNKLGSATEFVKNAHAAGLKVHPYTFRAENQFLPTEFRRNDDSPNNIGDFSGEMRSFFATGIDGVFSEHPDISVRVRGPC